MDRLNLKSINSKLNNCKLFLFTLIFLFLCVSWQAFGGDHYVLVTDSPYNADPTGAADATAAIQNAINSGKKTIVPQGSYRIDGTLVIGYNQHLHLSTGAWLKRVQQYSSSTAPVVRITANYASLTGDGHACGVTSENASGGSPSIINNGIVNVGPANLTQTFNIVFWNISSLVISDGADAWLAYYYSQDTSVDFNELLTVVCGQGTSYGAGGTYNGLVSNVLFQTGGVAIKMNPVSNGNLFVGNQFYHITKNIIELDSVNENCFSNIFVHGCHGATVIKLTNAFYNHFYGIMAEPGAEGFDGRYAAFCNIDEDCEDNVIFGHGNTGHASIIANDANLVSDHAEIKAPKIIAKELEATTIVGTIAGNFSVQSGNEFREVFIKSFTPTNPTQFQDVIRFTSELGASVFMVELSVVSANANTSNSAAVKYIISGKTDSANNATALATVIGGNEAIECNLVISGADVTIQLKPSYYLHGRLIVNADVRSSGDMTVTKL